MTLHDKIRSVFKDRIATTNYQSPDNFTTIVGTPEEIIAEIVAVCEKHGKN